MRPYHIGVTDSHWGSLTFRRYPPRCGQLWISRKRTPIPSKGRSGNPRGFRRKQGYRAPHTGQGLGNQGASGSKTYQAQRKTKKNRRRNFAPLALVLGRTPLFRRATRKSLHPRAERCGETYFEIRAALAGFRRDLRSLGAANWADRQFSFTDMSFFAMARMSIIGWTVAYVSLKGRLKNTGAYFIGVGGRCL